MQATRQKNTKPEKALQAELARLGLTFEVDTRPLPQLPRRADIVFRPEQVAVFVDGCFWHGCPIHGTWPKENADFWRQKIEANKARDLNTDQALENAGWSVVRVWEHESKEAAAYRAQLALSRQGR